MNSDQKRIILAIVISAVIMLGWQLIFPPPKLMPTSLSETQQVLPSTNTLVSENDIKLESTAKEIKQVKPELVSIKLSNKDHSFVFTNKTSITGARNSNSVKDFSEIFDADVSFQLYVLNNDRYEEIYLTKTEKLNDFSFKGISPSGLVLNFNLQENGKLNYEVESPKATKFKLVFYSSPKKSDTGMIRYFEYLSNELNTIEVGKEEKKDADIKWLGLDYNYHAFLMTLNNKVMMKLRTTPTSFEAETAFELTSLAGSFVFTKKNYDTLVDLGENLKLSVDFGFWSILAVPILRILQFFYNFIPNYGVAIILLTLLLRLVTFPLQHKSMKSMKKMQEVQPELTKIREKFKDDPQRMQKETMEVFKRTGYNPLGGCLPLLLQLPIFFAFYKMLYNAVELVGSPFCLWINDLSIKDPYYVLPILMGLSFLLQQKLTPTPTADPMQKKMMMFLPLVFVFIMKDLPAGLNLYIFVSTLFGVIQQLIVTRIKT